MVNIAVWEADMVITPNDWVFKERRWISVATYEAGDFQDVINAISSGEHSLWCMRQRSFRQDD